MTSQVSQIPKRRRHGHWLSALASLSLIGINAAWILGSNSWVIDLLANLAAQLSLVASVAALIALALRRWLLTAILVFAAIVGAAGPRLQPRLPRSLAGGDDAALVSIVVFNGSSGGLDHAADAFDMLWGADADLIVLLEPSAELLDIIRASEPFTNRYPYRRLPDSAGAGWRVVFTRWPHRGGEAFQDGPDAAASHGLHVMVVDRPMGSFGFVQVNPESSRTPARHRRGNQRIRDAVQAINARLKPLDIPILAAGDINSTPTGWRSRHFAAQTGLHRAKPAHLLDGSFPAWAPRPLRIAIDDAWGSPGIAVRSWILLPSCGSDHRAVKIVVELPVQPARASEGSLDEEGGSMSQPSPSSSGP